MFRSTGAEILGVDELLSKVIFHKERRLLQSQYNNNLLSRKVREGARDLLLESKNNELLDNDDLAVRVDYFYSVLYRICGTS